MLYIKSTQYIYYNTPPSLFLYILPIFCHLFYYFKNIFHENSHMIYIEINVAIFYNIFLLNR